MNSEVDLHDFLEVFAAWDAAYRTERETADRLYRAKIQSHADEQSVRSLLAEFAARRSASDELLTLLAAQFDGWSVTPRRAFWPNPGGTRH